MRARLRQELHRELHSQWDNVRHSVVGTPIKPSLFPDRPNSAQFAGDPFGLSFHERRLKFVCNTPPYYALRYPLLTAGFLRTDSVPDATLLLTRPYQSTPLTLLREEGSDETMLKPHHILNHFPGSALLGNKGSLAKLLAHSPLTTDVLPTTHVFPTPQPEVPQLDFDNYILKPCKGACGKGIKVLSRAQVAANLEELTEKSVVIQQYLEPMLVHNRKWDLRLYVFVPSVDPLRVYLHQDGLVRFATQEYCSQLGGVTRHLTNYSVNRLSSIDDNNPVVQLAKHDGDGQGTKLSCSQLSAHLEKLHGVQYVESLWEDIKHLIVKTTAAAVPHIRRKNSGVPTSQCYEIFGFDVFVDNNGKAWLLEVNILPSFEYSSQFDWAAKTAVLSDAWNMLSIPVEGESVQHNCNKQLSMLKAFEDEYHVRNGYELLFPTVHQSHQSINSPCSRRTQIDAILGAQSDSDAALWDWQTAKHFSGKTYRDLIPQTCA